MFERPDDNFEPSSTTKEAMLFVRKRPLLIAGIKHPGYFGIHNYTVDWVLFLLALCLELLGLYAIFFVLSESEVGSFSAAAFIASSLFVVDLALAIFHHRYSTGVNSALEIYSVIAARGGGTAGNISSQNHQDQISSRRRKAFFLSIALVLIAAIKFALVYFLNPNDVESAGGMLIFLAVAYPITAAIHIRVTGYLLHAVWASWLHNRDVDVFKKTEGKVNIATDHIGYLTIHDAFRQGIKVDRHEIKVTPANDTTPEMCKLICKGILFDSEIERFGNLISDSNARTEFVLCAMELQTKIASIKP